MKAKNTQLWAPSSSANSSAILGIIAPMHARSR
jgi:hypothetical protein